MILGIAVTLTQKEISTQIHERGVVEMCSEREEDTVEVDEIDARGEYTDIIN